MNLNEIRIQWELEKVLRATLSRFVGEDIPDFETTRNNILEVFKTYTQTLSTDPDIAITVDNEPTRIQQGYMTVNISLPNTPQNRAFMDALKNISVNTRIPRELEDGQGR